MVATEVPHGPCPVASKTCVGKTSSKNSEHTSWKWRKITKAGELTADDPRCGEESVGRTPSEIRVIAISTFVRENDDPLKMTGSIVALFEAL
jgi:hypothetical protein